jgi:glycosyltransferase involved in cell wall biosynthesis
MKVLHVIPAVAPRYGGPSAAVVGMCRALRPAGVDTLIATTDADGSSRLPVRLGERTAFEDVPAIFFARQATEAFKWSLPLSRWLHRHVGDFDAVHIHALFSHSSIAAGRACRSTGVPYVLRPLGTLDPWSLGRHAWRKKALIAAAGRRLIDGAAAVHYTSAEEARLASQGFDRMAPAAVVPLGIDDELFADEREAHGDRPRVLLSMSRLEEKKGIDILIAAFHEIASVDALSEWRLVIAGDGAPAYVSRLKHLAGGGGARDRIAFAGWVDGDARRHLLRDARLFVLPSAQENFGIAVVEAMAAGLPAVVSPAVNLAADIQTAGAGWIADRTPEALAATIGTALSDDSELERRGSSARRFAERFRWTLVAGALRQLYESVATAGAVPLQNPGGMERRVFRPGVPMRRG